MKKYLGLENYDGILPAQIKELEIDGFILGDPFCQYRMFKCGDYDLMDFIRMLSEFGKEIIYQTPVYVTDRNFMSVTKAVTYLHDKYGVKKYLVQDIGLADWIIKTFFDVDVIWSHWGRNRNSLMNHDFIEFLIKLGVVGIESKQIERIKEISKAGLLVFAVYGNLVYSTLSRECYCSYMLDQFDGMCARECLDGKMSLHSNHLQMTVDGHILGRKIQYPEDPNFLETVRQYSDLIMIYAVDFRTAVKSI